MTWAVSASFLQHKPLTLHLRREKKQKFLLATRAICTPSDDENKKIESVTQRDRPHLLKALSGPRLPDYIIEDPDFNCSSRPCDPDRVCPLHDVVFQKNRRGSLRSFLVASLWVLLFPSTPLLYKSIYYAFVSPPHHSTREPDHSSFDENIKDAYVIVQIRTGPTS